ncbi:tubulinyl-Tyr carboxypeptidase 2-like isoform X1 [Dysidea avara]|uniref:tubulinyl-Tyr carboxypeptidase 2-like isoform X1 n=1 Tax=Dysidea avara TaxID=196820 RepID=UPI003329117E
MTEAHDLTGVEQQHKLDDIISKWWHVNKGGFPIASDTWDKMWYYVRQVHPDGEQVEVSIRGELHAKVSYPVPPVITSSSSVTGALASIQDYLLQLQYNHTGTQFFDIKRYRSIAWLMDTAKEIIRVSLPIKCLEAFILSLYLTAPLSQLHRFAISFKSKCDGHTHRHVVMGVYCTNQFGALGLSRKRNLMDKRLQVKSLTELLEDYMQVYNSYNHKVVKVKLSLPIVHDLHSHEPIPWKGLIIRPTNMTPSELKKTVEKYSRIIKLSTI